MGDEANIQPQRVLCHYLNCISNVRPVRKEWKGVFFGRLTRLERRGSLASCEPLDCQRCGKRHVSGGVHALFSTDWATPVADESDRINIEKKRSRAAFIGGSG